MLRHQGHDRQGIRSRTLFWCHPTGDVIRCSTLKQEKQVITKLGLRGGGAREDETIHQLTCGDGLGRSSIDFFTSQCADLSDRRIEMSSRGRARAIARCQPRAAGSRSPAPPPTNGLGMVAGLIKGRNAPNSHQGRVREREQRASSRKCRARPKPGRSVLVPHGARSPVAPRARGGPLRGVTGRSQVAMLMAVRLEDGLT